MLLEYKPTSTYDTLMMRGVVLNVGFQLFEIECDKTWNQYPEFDNTDYPPPYRCSYGVCDSLENLLWVYPELLDEGKDCRKFVVNMTCIDKADEEESGGWRWHKWGEYIGTQKPTTEYLYDEPEIERVYCYQIYEKI